MPSPTLLSPIRPSSNGRYFTDPGGEPVFWLGDTQWELFRCHSEDTAMQILRDRRSKGINVILIMLIGLDKVRFGDESTAPYADPNGQLPWTDDDPLRPNESYFRRIDSMIRLGEQTGQTFCVGVYHQWQYETVTIDKARAWGHWVGERYRDVPNLIWSMYPRAEPGYIPVCRELAAGLQAGDGGAHLISIHPDPAVASSSFMPDEEWLAFNMIQTCMSFDRIHEAVTADYARTPAKPVVMAEGAYEGLEFGRVQSAHDVRKQAWWSQMSGGHHVYGHNDAWVNPSALGDWLGSQGSQHLKVFREAFASIDGWWDLVPDQSLFASGVGEGFSLNTAARSAEGRWVLAYLSDPSTVSLRLDDLADSKEAIATWIDPRTGDRIPMGPVNPSDPLACTTPKGWEDAVLLIAES